jgi:hypothetical protein
MQDGDQKTLDATNADNLDLLRRIVVALERIAASLEPAKKVVKKAKVPKRKKRR